MKKSDIRRTYLNQLKQLPPDQSAEKSSRIGGRLLQTSEFAAARSIALTISRKTEVDTRSIIEACWESGKHVAVPKCDPLSREMQFRRIESFEQLETVYLNLQEPIERVTDLVDRSAMDLIIVPGVVFSPAGYRIGYGGGYYDRFREGYDGPTISLAFEMQLASGIPNEPFDIPVGKIITEERVILCSQED